MSRALGTIRRVALLLLIATPVAAQQPTTDAPVRIFFVRHGEVDAADPATPLNARGQQRAAELVRVFDRVGLTHVFASHTLRSRQAVEPTAAAHRLGVVELPPLGTVIEGVAIHGASASRVALGPLADALSKLPAGSVALVGGNGDNLFGIWNRLGVPLEASCTLGRACVPCLDNTCFPAEFDNLWILTLRGSGQTPELTWLKYGNR